MPAKHNIDSKNKLITTTWSGEASDDELIDAITKYQREIKGNPDCLVYNEIVDFSRVKGLKITTKGITRIGQIAVKTDQLDIETKLAIIVSSSLAYGLARMYAIYRNFTPNNNKQIRIFKKMRDAHEWIEMNT